MEDNKYECSSIPELPKSQLRPVRQAWGCTLFSNANQLTYAPISLEMVNESGYPTSASWNTASRNKCYPYFVIHPSNSWFCDFNIVGDLTFTPEKLSCFPCHEIDKSEEGKLVLPDIMNVSYLTSMLFNWCLTKTSL